jgi:hypothetical protein
MPNAVGLKIRTPDFEYANKEWSVEDVYKQMQKGGSLEISTVLELICFRWNQYDSQQKLDRSGRPKNGLFPKQQESQNIGQSYKPERPTEHPFVSTQVCGRTIESNCR